MEPKTCDIVMQGGITSGVVYPAAVLALKNQFRFVNIGGASAGAIAAAFTAAAEIGRARDGAGFERLQAISDELSQEGFLVRLFQPSERTRPLLEMFLAILRGVHARRFRTLRILLRAFGAACTFLGPAVAVGAGAGSALYAAVIWWTRGEFGGRSLALATLLVASGMGVGTLVSLVTRAVRDIQRNGFGIARGLTTGETPALTNWLTTKLDELAGLQDGDEPLTFGMLERGAVTLRMITTNLSEQRPYRLPFENHRFIFSKEEMNDYFPRRIVDHLVKYAEPSTRVTLPSGYHFLPAVENLPVVVATRLSLSFPILVSALPLYNMRITGHAPKDAPRVIHKSELRRCWFSDGGICSNFPIHFFDGWVPSRPTFGISLITGEVEPVHNVRGVAPAVEASDPYVHLPAANQPEPTVWKDIGGLPGFLGRVVGTALDYRDTLQRELPSYRERVVQIRLTNEEGGLNLDMSKDRVDALVKRGRAAGERLATFDFSQHLWVRLRVLVPRLVEQLHKLRERGREGLLDLAKLERLAQEGGAIYPASDRWCREAQALLNALTEAEAQLSAVTTQESEPRPPSVMRVTPPV